jgi:hypothetical protein
MFNTSILGKLSKEIAFIPFQKSGIFTVHEKHGTVRHGLI